MQVTSAPHHVAVALPGLLELALLELPALLPPPMEGQEQSTHLPCPHLAVLFPQELEFPQQMLVAQGVLALLIGKIGFPVIMHDPLAASAHDAQSVHRLDAALGMDAITGQRSRRGHMQPVESPVHAQPALIQVNDLGQRHLAGQRLREGIQLLTGALVGRHQRRDTQRLPK